MNKLFNQHYKVFLTAALLFSFLLIASFVSPRITAQQATQMTEQGRTTSLQLPGLRQRVTVRRDSYGVPYIAAENETDLYFAQGVVTAQDRLWQMDLLRRLSRGEVSEIFGRIALEEDKRRRRYGFAAQAEMQVKSMSVDLRSALEAYARGVNAFIASRDEQTLPVEFRVLKYRPRDWTPADTLVIGKLMAEDLSTSWRVDLIRAALADLPKEKREALLPVFSPIDVLVYGSDVVKRSKANAALPAGKKSAALSVSPEVMKLVAADFTQQQLFMEQFGFDVENRAASNNWVVSGRRSVTGKPLLANDPHLAPSVPSIWHLVHLSAPGLRVAGVTFPGSPGVTLGHNERIAWGATNLGPDVQDLYLETFDPENPRRYKTPAGWAEAEIRREQIKVRKAPTDPTTETIDYEVTITRHGPIFFEEGEGRNRKRYALRWTSLDADAEQFLAFHQLNRARNWNDFCEALKTYPGPTQNFIFADVDGHIGWYGAGHIPIRKSGDGSVPYDGSTDDGAWLRYIPFDKLPHVYDPPAGMIVTANSRVVGRDYPFHLTNEWVEPYRARRIHDLLSAKAKLSVDDLRNVQSDVYSITTKTFAHAAVKTVNALLKAGSDEKMHTDFQILAQWDGNLSADSRAAVLAMEMREAFRLKMLKSFVGETRAASFRWFNFGTFLDRVITQQPKEWLPSGANSYAELVVTCYHEARANLTKRLGAEERQWTFAHPASRTRWWKHPLADAPFIGPQFRVPFFATGGNGTTPNVGPTVSMRLIADVSNWDNSRHGIATGVSGDPASSHYKDQMEDWRLTRPRVFPFASEAVAKAAKQTLVLMP
jgi:penicillin amidase